MYNTLSERTQATSRCPGRVQLKRHCNNTMYTATMGEAVDFRNSSIFAPFRRVSFVISVDVNPGVSLVRSRRVRRIVVKSDNSPAARVGDRI